MMQASASGIPLVPPFCRCWPSPSLPVRNCKSACALFTFSRESSGLGCSTSSTWSTCDSCASWMPPPVFVFTPRLMRPALWWFRWASVVTVLVGIWYWMIIIGEDKASALAVGLVPHPGLAIGSFFVIWTVVSFVIIGILSMGKLNRKGPLLAIIFAVLIAAAAWLYLSLNSSGWESNRQLCIGIGGGLGWVMMNNVWGVLWRAQKRILQWTESSANPADPAPPDIQKLMLLSAVTAWTNFWLTFPMLFFMVCASHYILFLAH